MKLTKPRTPDKSASYIANIVAAAAVPQALSLLIAER